MKIPVIMSMKPKSIEDAYAAGYDCGKNGPNTENCHFGLFCDQSHTDAWSAGKTSAERERKP